MTRRWLKNWAYLLVLVGAVVVWMLLLQVAINYSALTANIYMGVSFALFLGYIAFLGTEPD